MAAASFWFAGGGTGGHIYPAIAVAEQILHLQPDAEIHFFCSTRRIDSLVLDRTGFEYNALPAKGFSLRPARLLDFVRSFRKSCRAAEQLLAKSTSPIVVGVGGFVAAPACWSAHKLGIPVVLVNVDIVPGRANKFIARFADRIFVQFEETADYFKKTMAVVDVVGCPLRTGFSKPDPAKAIRHLALHKDKNILLITGASSGSENINNTVCSLLDKLSSFSEDWQLVHLTGRANFHNVQQKYTAAKIAHKVLDYYDDMPDLLAAAALVIGRSGAVSVAEYAAAGVPSICMPYPYHRDRHQYLNAGKLVDAGAAVIVEDLPDDKDRTEWLWQELAELMSNQAERREMAANCRSVTKANAASQIATALTEMRKA